MPSSKPKTSRQPPDSAADTISFTKAQQATLTHLSDLLHLFHHRNKNQHRRSTWYRHFATFRKQLRALLSSIELLNATPTTHVERSRKRARDVEVRGQIERRLVFWRGVAVERWWRGFSQAVAEGRFAVLGVFLVGVLGEVCGVVGVMGGLGAEGEEGEREGREAIERFGREWAVEEGWGGRGAVGEGVEDVGVAVGRGMDGGESDRNDVVVEGAGDVAAGSEALQTDMSLVVGEQRTGGSPISDAVASREHAGQRTAAPLEARLAKKPKTKKRKKGDAIDDLFSGLG